MPVPIPLPDPMQPGSLPTALAPMQDVTDLAFMQILGRNGVPDYFFTEFLRVHDHSILEKNILDSILYHGTDRPVFAQLIGENLFNLKRIAILLQEYPIAGIDLNMGCPAPKVYRKNVGGGLLREPDRIEQIFAELRECCHGRFTVKMRIGFEDDRHFLQILDLINKYQVDCLSLHGRTVKQMYRGMVDYESIKIAVEKVNCPVFANGNVTSAEKALQVKSETGCFGVMVGRSAIRNPWIFRQIREASLGNSYFRPTLGDVRNYIDHLWNTLDQRIVPESHRISRMKKFVNFIGQGIDPHGIFLKRMRRAIEADDFFGICDEFMVNNGKKNSLFSTEPFAGVVARPNQEGD